MMQIGLVRGVLLCLYVTVSYGVLFGHKPTVEKARCYANCLTMVSRSEVLLTFFKFRFISYLRNIYHERNVCKTKLLSRSNKYETITYTIKEKKERKIGRRESLYIKYSMLKRWIKAGVTYVLNPTKSFKSLLRS